MPHQRIPTRDKQRASRLKNRAQEQTAQPPTEEDAIDAAIKRSIDEFGA